MPKVINRELIYFDLYMYPIYDKTNLHGFDSQVALWSSVLLHQTDNEAAPASKILVIKTIVKLVCKIIKVTFIYTIWLYVSFAIESHINLNHRIGVNYYQMRHIPS